MTGCACTVSACGCATGAARRTSTKPPPALDLFPRASGPPTLRVRHRVPDARITRAKPAVACGDLRLWTALADRDPGGAASVRDQIALGATTPLQADNMDLAMALGRRWSDLPTTAGRPRLADLAKGGGGVHTLYHLYSYTGDAIYIKLMGDYSPPTDRASKQATLEYVWRPFYAADCALDQDALASMVGTWDASTKLGAFWQNGWGPTYAVFLYALRMLCVYNSHITSSDPYGKCDNARARVAAGMAGSGYTGGGGFGSGSLRYTIDVDWHDEFHGDGSEVGYNGSGLPYMVSGAGESRSFGWAQSGNIHINRRMVRELGFAADALLAVAHKTVWYVRSLHVDDLASAGYLFEQATRLGRMALDCVAFIAHTVLHEMLHVEFNPAVLPWQDVHCQAACCMNRIAGNWYCKTFAYLGLTQCNYFDIDTLFNSTALGVGSTCDVDRGLAWDGTCTMPSLGEPGSTNFDKEHWEVPDGCT
jgi:hypothetical protein